MDSTNVHRPSKKREVPAAICNLQFPSCRLLPFSVENGPINMAADEVLLESALGGVASLRFYAWSEATLTLGYFQAQEVRHCDDRLAALPYVRRLSGGAALVHHHELTYALALPPEPPWQARRAPAATWLCKMHQLIAGGLKDLGVAAHPSPCDDKGGFSGFLCFQHVTRGDLLIGPAKVAGSAQRRQRGALLQHGSILLAASPHALVLPGIRELSGPSLTAEETARAVQNRLVQETGWDLQPADWTNPERSRREALVANKYFHKRWNDRR